MCLHRYAPIILALALCVISFRPAFAQTNDKIDLTNRDIHGEYVPAGSPAVMIPFVADPSAAGGDVFDTMCSDPAAIVTLILPDGTEVSVANAEALGFFYTVIQDGSFARSQILSPFSMPGTHTIIKLPALSPAGNYQIKVNGSSVAEDAVALTTYYSSSTVKSALAIPPSIHRVCDTIIVTGVLLDNNAAITQANVVVDVADASSPDANPIQITLSDSGPYDSAPGDGLYTGTFVPEHAGDYELTLQATGISNTGINFSRLSQTSLHVDPPLATFVSFADSPVNNANGFIDRINLTANLTVTTPGNYRFTATLAANNGNEITSSVEGHLDAGNQQLSIPFSADSLFSLGVDGPYLIKNAFLILKDDQNNSLADSRADAGATAAYQLASFNTSNGAADLSLTNIGEPSPVQVVQQLNYSLAVYNLGSATATTVVLTDPLPPNVTFNSVTPSQGTCNGTAPITCVLGDIASNESVTVQVSVTTTTVGSLTNNASVTTATRDVNTANNLATSVFPLFRTPASSL